MKAMGSPRQNTFSSLPKKMTLKLNSRHTLKNNSKENERIVPEISVIPTVENNDQPLEKLDTFSILRKLRRDSKLLSA